ncbi:MAG TPA: NIF family HAD-type phosphatase [Acidimicrobiales bacterium]|jgi:phosphoglycolate phosphatase-like HAD superfamily hydrolase
MNSERLSSEPVSSVRGGPQDAWWVFDVDGCLVDSLTGTSLRPGARLLLAHLHENSVQVMVWSAGGDTYAQERARQFSFEHFISGFFAKRERDADGCYRTDHLPTACVSGVFVDDRPEDLSKRLEVIAVSPYLSDDPHDRGLEAAARRAGFRLAASETPTSDLAETISYFR